MQSEGIFEIKVIINLRGTALFGDKTCTSPSAKRLIPFRTSKADISTP